MSETGAGPTRSVYDLGFDEITRLLGILGEPTFRVRQLWEWLYTHFATGFDEMTNLPSKLRSELSQRIPFGTPRIVASKRSRDGMTRKDALCFPDGETVESVLMHYERRHTACVSTQVGCAVGCAFCATGQMGFRRDLSSGEIVAQAIHFARSLRSEGRRLTNVVLMGMGEPLLNYSASLGAVRRLIDPLGLGMGQRRITVSTVGVAPAIRRLAEEGLEITLAVSLHAATDQLRDQLVPMNRRYALDELLEACRAYVARMGRRVSIEWALIEGVNDMPEQAEALATRLRGLLAHVNLIPLNPVAGYGGKPSSPAGKARFIAELERLGVPHSIRTARGFDIQAGCGQLAVRGPVHSVLDR